MKLKLDYFITEIDDASRSEINYLKILYPGEEFWAAYGRYMKLRQIIASRDHAKLPYSSKLDKLVLAGDLGMEIPDLEAFISKLIELELLSVKSRDFITENRIYSLCQEIIEGRKKGQARARRSHENSKFQNGETSPKKGESSLKKGESSPKRNQSSPKKQESSTKIDTNNTTLHNTTLHNKHSKDARKEEGGLSSRENSQPFEKKKEKSSAKKESEIPTLEEFIKFAESYLHENGISFDGYPMPLKAKYDQWVANDWRNGCDKPIKNWKTALPGVFQYIKPIKPHENLSKADRAAQSLAQSGESLDPVVIQPKNQPDE